MRKCKFIRMINKARTEANKSHHLHQHGCVAITPRGKIVASGYNRFPYRDVQKCREKWN